MKNRDLLKKIVGISILVAIEIVLQIIGNFVAIGSVNINLSLITIVVAGIMFGPVGGLILGLVNGVVVILSPSTLAIFVPLTLFGTILVCLVKGGLAGLLAGFVFKVLKNKKLGSILASIIVPLVNTIIFMLGSLVFFRPFLEENMGDYSNAFMFLILGVIGFNFVFELLSTSIISPFVIKALNARRHK